MFQQTERRPVSAASFCSFVLNTPPYMFLCVQKAYLFGLLTSATINFLTPLKRLQWISISKQICPDISSFLVRYTFAQLMSGRLQCLLSESSLFHDSCQETLAIHYQVGEMRQGVGGGGGGGYDG